MKKILLIIICLALIITVFSACDKDNTIISKPKLSMPDNVHFDGTLLKWDAVEKADLYVITVYVNRSSYTITEKENFYEMPISTAGDYHVKIKARKTDGTYRDSDSTEAQVYHLGTGEKTDPIIIYSKTELARIGIGAKITIVDKVSVTTPLYFVLHRDIDLGGEEWKPIGAGDNRFQGHFDGSGFTISNFKITTADGGMYGLFKGVLNGSVRNLNVTDYNINIVSNGTYKIGGLAGHVSSSKIVNCNVSGAINFKAPSDTNTQYIGQIVGILDKMRNSENPPSMMTCCSASGTITAEGYKIYSGGLAGQVENSSLDRCYSTGSVTTKGKYLYNGGMAGYMTANGAFIKNSYSRTEVSADSSYLVYAGSLISMIYLSDTGINTLENSYATGSVSAVNGSTIYKGFIGYVSGSPRFSGAYYDYETTLLGENKDIGNKVDHAKIYSRLTEQMKKKANYAEWDFDKIWDIDAERNDGYPFLKAISEEEIREIFNEQSG